MNEIPIIRTTYPYLTAEEKESLENLKKELKERNMSYEDKVREIFSEIGIDIDLEEIMKR